MKKYKIKKVLFVSQVLLLITLLVLVNSIGFTMYSNEFSDRQDTYINEALENLVSQRDVYLSTAIFVSKINAANQSVVNYLSSIDNDYKEESISNLQFQMKKQIDENYLRIKDEYSYISNLAILDMNGFIVYEALGNKIENPRSDELTIKAQRGLESNGVNYSLEAKKIVLEGNYPVYSDGKVVGLVKSQIYLDNTIFSNMKDEYSFDVGIMYNEDIMYFSNADADLDSLIVKTGLGKSIINEKVYDELYEKDMIYIEKVSFWGDDRYLTILKPLISYDEKLLGICILSYDLKAEKIANLNTIKNMITMMAMVAFLIILLGYIVTSHISVSIITLKNKLKIINDNNLANIEIDLDTKIEEIDDLLKEFNSMIERIVGHKEENKYLEILSNKDGLTGFWNHKFFYEKLSDYMIDSKQFSLLFLDIDKFKQINDKLGHKIGDRVLLELSRSLSERYPEYEYFRYGGEEFAIVMMDTRVVDAFQIAENIRSFVETSEKIKEISHGAGITISIGVTSSEIGSLSIDELVSKADKAMYYGKYNGRNQSNIFDNEVELFFETQEADIIKRESIHTAVESLISTLEEKDFYSGSHSKFVEKFSVMLGKRIGLSSNSLDNLKMAASLHDIGKIGVPDQILKSNNQLNEVDYEVAKEHSTIGFNIAKHLFKDEEILKGIRNHHERWDGCGYPDKLKKDSIPLFARIISIADTYHSMIYGSHYRVKKSKEDAVDDLIRNSGTQFDPSLVDIFIDIVNDNYIYNGVEKDMDEIIQSTDEYVSTPLGMYDVYDSTHYVMEVDKNYKIIFVNKAISDMLGAEADELIGKKCYTSILGNKSSCSNCKIPEVIYEKSVKESTKVERRKNGEIVAINQVFMPLFDAEGNVDHIMEFAYDKESKDLQKIEND